jgi:hypothetical protein
VHLDPTDENVRHLLDRHLTGPVVMLNLLRFRETADYGDHPDLAPPAPISGRAAYDRYIAHTLPFLTARGGGVDFIGDGGHVFVGPPGERWDLALLVRQASLEDFFAFASDTGYLAGIGHRVAAVEDTRILPLVPRMGS